jgi:ATP-binding cassette subfamily B protein
MKFIAQRDGMDCGATCLAMIAGYYGKNYEATFLREKTFITKEGVSVLGITQAAQSIGFEALTIKATTQNLLSLIQGKEAEAPLPCILHWNQNHFVVLYAVKKKWFSQQVIFKIADPGYGFINLSQEKFEKSWLSDDNQGVAVLLEPKKAFYATQLPKKEKISLRYLLGYLKGYKKQIIWLFILLFLGNVLNLIFPFLTQHLIDTGIKNKNLNLITLILAGQLSLFLGSIVIEIFRNWLTLFVGTKLSIQIISDFLKKLLKLPLKFFDSKHSGDIQQRIQDNERIEHFITSQSLLTFFSMVTFVVFFGVLFYYNPKILALYLILTILAVWWSFFWLKQRRIVDYYKFQQQAENQASIWEMIQSVTEMKLNQFEEFKRQEWEEIQQKLFKINMRILRIDRFQTSGFDFINQLKNILVTFLSAYAVVQGKMTLGELLSVSYIIGQMNNPVNQLVAFFRSLQDAKLSLERLNEVQVHPEEEQPNQIPLLPFAKNNQAEIALHNIAFQYEGPKSAYVLKDVTFSLPQGKITAIVGASGSGKTTLMKLLLKFYEPTEGKISINGEDLTRISAKSLRENCGVVMQDGYIFSDAIARNIATGEADIDEEKLKNALKIANIEKFIEELPLGLNTKVGSSGNGISGGQKQRILIARAVYKNPQYIFFDEATSALDAENEKIIHDNLQDFFKGKTVLIIAHRLSTVKNADQIIVLKHGKIVEKGNHQQLVANKADYFNLVKNQLELGN